MCLIVSVEEFTAPSLCSWLIFTLFGPDFRAFSRRWQEYTAPSVTCMTMAPRFTRRISAIFSHSLKVSGVQCQEPTLPPRYRPRCTHSLARSGNSNRRDSAACVCGHAHTCTSNRHKCVDRSGERWLAPCPQCRFHL